MKRALTSAAAVLALALAGAPSAHADQLGYLVNVTVRPGYNFANADYALGYGYSVCERVGAKESYAQLVDEVNRDVGNADYYQVAYLNQAVNELCPAQIWQLRQSAAGYTA
jgi:hypothetical protein